MQNKDIQITYDTLLDAVEARMSELGTVDIPVVHVFSPGLYTRSMVDVPPDTYLVSYIHKTPHQFIMSKGKIVVYTEKEGMVILQAPYLNLTEAGTRRFAKTMDYVTWTSIHATNIQPKDDSKEAFDEAVRLVEEELFEKRENVFLFKAQDLELCQA